MENSHVAQDFEIVARGNIAVSCNVHVATD